MMILRRIWFCLTVPKNFLEKLFCVSELFWYGKKFMDKDGGGGGGRNITFFRLNFFVSQCPKTTWGHQCFRKFRLSKILRIRSVYHHSTLSILPHTAKKICFSRKFWYRIFSCIGGGHHGFTETFCFT